MTTPTFSTFSIIVDFEDHLDEFTINKKYVDTIKDFLVRYELKSEGIDP